MSGKSSHVRLAIAGSTAYIETTPIFSEGVSHQKMQWRLVMKRLSMIAIIVLLASCSSTGMRGSSGASGISNSSPDSEKPYSQRVLQPGDTYFGD